MPKIANLSAYRIHLSLCEIPSHIHAPLTAAVSESDPFVTLIELFAEQHYIWEKLCLISIFVLSFMTFIMKRFGIYWNGMIKVAVLTFVLLPTFCGTFMYM